MKPGEQALLEALPEIPRDDNGPVFAEPWQAQAFAMAVTLNERGVFSWTEWAEALSSEIAGAQASGDPDLGDTYYRHWLSALEKLVTSKEIATGDTLARLQEDWDQAARATPHGHPIVLHDRKS